MAREVRLTAYDIIGDRMLAEEAHRPELTCCDYSVPRSGRMVAYRWDGEAELSAANFVESDV